MQRHRVSEEWGDFDYCLEVSLSSVTAWVVEKIACLVMVTWVNSVDCSNVIQAKNLCDFAVLANKPRK